MTGKEKCRMLRKMRKQIADLNGIPYPGEAELDCEYGGEDCVGTCPQCENEVTYLERFLVEKRRSGEEILLKGIAAGSLPFCSEPEAMTNVSADADDDRNLIPEHMKNLHWWELADDEFPAELVVRLTGSGILTVEQLLSNSATDLKEDEGLGLQSITKLNRMLERHGLPQIRGTKALERRQIKGMMRRPW